MLSRGRDDRFDYRGWMHRALVFMDRVGRIEDVEVRSRSVGPRWPFWAMWPAGWIAGRPIPSTLAEFLRFGAGSLDCSFEYAPVDEPLDELRSILPSEITIYGGARLCSPPQLALAARHAREWTRDTWIADDPVQRDLWLHAQPFVRIDNGDHLALDTRAGVPDPPVICLNHDEASFTIAPTFTAFLHAWERLCYIGPEHWLLGEFRGPDGYLDPHSARAAALRRLLGAEQ